jgi:adenine-specific DNA-methyltransferase
MGAKHDLAPMVALAIRTAAPGAVLDLFSGMCSLAGAVAASDRQVWCNDVQAYAGLAASVLVGLPTDDIDPHQILEAVRPHYIENQRPLESRFEEDLHVEQELLVTGAWRALAEVQLEWKHVGNDEALAQEAASLRAKLESPHRLFAITFAHGYFGLKQAIEIDSVRAGLDRALVAREISEDQFAFGLFALMKVLSRTSSSPGHFAEFLHMRDQASGTRIMASRKRSVWTEFASQLDRIEPYGSAHWRRGNRIFSQPAEALLEELEMGAVRPAVIYADPPYSRAQYSRYYHVLETLIQYDYPVSSGSGRYRADRFQTPFSHVRAVESAFENLVAGAAALRSQLILSYPSNGLLAEANVHAAWVLRRHFRRVRLVYRADKRHSTLGSAPGVPSRDVVELVYSAQGER